MATPTPKTLKAPHTGCPECTKSMKGADPRAVFCTPRCRKIYHNRDTAIGGPLVVLAKAWRQGRHKKGSKAASYALAQFVDALDRANAADRSAGRMPALQMVEARYRRDGITFEPTS